MPVVSEFMYLGLKSIVQNTADGPQTVELDLPTVWDPTPFMEWVNPTWQGQDSVKHPGWRVALFRVRQAQMDYRGIGLPKMVEHNRWLVRLQNPVFPEQIDEQIYTPDSVMRIFHAYLLECHPE